MAILHHKEEKIQVVLGRLPKNYTHEQFVEMFIKLYSKDWGKIKSAYVKQSQDKEPGTIITMPKPDLYLKQLVDTYLTLNSPIFEEVKEKAAITVKPKAPSKKKEEKIEEPVEVVKKPKAVAKKKIETDVVSDEVVKKTKVTTKKAILTEETIDSAKEVKKKAPVKKKVETEKVEATKLKTVKTKEK